MRSSTLVNAPKALLVGWDKRSAGPPTRLALPVAGASACPTLHSWPAVLCNPPSGSVNSFSLDTLASGLRKFSQSVFSVKAEKGANRGLFRRPTDRVNCFCSPLNGRTVFPGRLCCETAGKAVLRPDPLQVPRMRFATLVLTNIRRRPMRSALTVSGVAIAVTAVVALVGIARSFEKTLLSIYESRG